MSNSTFPLSVGRTPRGCRPWPCTVAVADSSPLTRCFSLISCESFKNGTPSIRTETSASAGFSLGSRTTRRPARRPPSDWPFRRSTSSTPSRMLTRQDTSVNVNCWYTPRSMPTVATSRLVEARVSRKFLRGDRPPFGISRSKSSLDDSAFNVMAGVSCQFLIDPDSRRSLSLMRKASRLRSAPFRTSLRRT